MRIMVRGQAPAAPVGTVPVAELQGEWNMLSDVRAGGLWPASLAKQRRRNTSPTFSLGRSIGRVSVVQRVRRAQPVRRRAPKAVDRFKERVRELTSRKRAVGIERMAEDPTGYLRGWTGYFGKCERPSALPDLEQWLRRRLRPEIWKQWKRGTTRFAELR